VHGNWEIVHNNMCLFEGTNFVIFSTKKEIFGKFMFFLCKIRLIYGENYQKILYYKLKNQNLYTTQTLFVPIFLGNSKTLFYGNSCLGRLNSTHHYTNPLEEIPWHIWRHLTYMNLPSRNEKRDIVPNL